MHNKIEDDNLEILNESTVKILVPRLHNIGGVANYYSVLIKHLSHEFVYIYRGSTSKNEPRLKIPWRLFKDYFVFFRKTRSKTKALVINSSLGKDGFFRDGFYFMLVPVKIKKIVFFRGWNPEFERKIDQSSFLKTWLKKTFFKADHIIVLSSQFKNKLIEWGFNKPVSIETTLVDENLLNGDNFKNLSDLRDRIGQLNILYLGNISKAKGVWELVECVKLLKSGSGIKGFTFTIAGDGQELMALKNYSVSHSLNIAFPGYVSGTAKVATFRQAHLYVFSSYHEGLPNSILEAMAFGLPIITTRVGGIPDFFENEKMGLFLDNRNPKHIAEKIRYLLDRPALMKQIAEYNYHYAKEHFYAPKIAKRFECIVESVINNRNN